MKNIEDFTLETSHALRDEFLFHNPYNPPRPKTYDEIWFFFKHVGGSQNYFKMLEANEVEEVRAALQARLAAEA